ncbi:hypothetical protein, conserved [Trypanosoma brucei gambiense DAL972]|uniref:Uncharacterized protein n=2 Tax=Trypanosoma brucei TaxID=5691 RepID=C9ZW04_TRYB9|nr:hypothetical protein, conserved [Trypanosoma brucei gambiense DAL972]RHW72978.1 hypothetical protein DPX39_040064300 [Trypanosoma brucei equiperdum]CBH13592.1 hypothetical protein, conserved [Trypanosoma brucei gambiense DAL972]|eukprot:XP_011775869.1 hypothetical protein, conserved [Trypanosoma brucei gambiense DAL972]
MSLSPQWSQHSVVVHSEGQAIVQQSQPHSFTPSSIGRPIIVRQRDPRVFTATPTASTSSIAAEGGGSVFALTSLVRPQDISETFWVPDATRNEVGLLEAIQKRTAANRTYVLVHSRPLAELQCNFSTCTGDNIDISHDVFRLSKASAALLQMERNLFDGGSAYLHGDAPKGGTGADADSFKSNVRMPRGPTGFKGNVPSKTFKEQLRMGLCSINEEEYYLVRYRDYSLWAVQRYADIAKKDGFWGKKYVEQCFAVHVGKEPGELIPITEAQFLFGIELLQRQILEYVGIYDSLDINYCALSRDQFRSLGVILGDGMRAVEVEGEEIRRRREEEEESKDSRANAHSDAYVPPSIWDWRPSAIKKRINHQLQLQYHAIGRLVVRVVMFGTATYIVCSYAQRFLPQAGSGNGATSQRRGKGYRGQGGNYDRNDTPFVSRGFLRSVMLGPKEVFDYLLAPSA